VASGRTGDKPIDGEFTQRGAGLPLGFRRGGRGIA
jgi:hypothetical protein